jgi:hypothetical protein
MGHGIPAGQYSTRCQDMKLPCTGIHAESGTLDRVSIDGKALRAVVAVQESKPGYTGLTNFTLAVIKHQGSISH